MYIQSCEIFIMQSYNTQMYVYDGGNGVNVKI